MPEVEATLPFDITNTLWDDNPATIDLLGINTVATTVQRALSNPALDPLTIGIHSPWGGGKTTTLNLLEVTLKEDGAFVVIRTDPWEYDDHSDVRGLLISEVVQTLAQTFKDTAGVSDKAKDLLKRISWSRVVAVAAKGVITTKWSTEEIIDAFTPQPRTEPKSMNGFRDAFAEFLEMLPNVKRVIVLVDDLDRCLPDAVTATLEAIKLFLSVEKMAFVLAADQNLVRDAIAASLDASGRADRFASNYLDKIVQLPVTLPQLSPDQAGSYIALLFSKTAAPDDAAFTALLAHCKTRREHGQVPVLGDLSGLTWQPDENLLTFAQRVADGLASNTVNNPRYIKRFLNALSIRMQIAKENGIDMDVAIIAKLFLLEDRFGKEFEHLVGLSHADRVQLLTDWEKWGQADTDTRPEKVRDETREWAASAPALAATDLDRYFALAASFRSVVLGALLDDSQIELARNLTSSSETIRSGACDTLKDKPESEQSQIIDAMFSLVRSLDDADGLIKSAVEIAKNTPSLADKAAESIKHQAWAKLSVAAVAELKVSGVEVLTGLVPEIAADENLDQMVRTAAQQD
jgi:hypothetical protein